MERFFYALVLTLCLPIFLIALMVYAPTIYSKWKLVMIPIYYIVNEIFFYTYGNYAPFGVGIIAGLLLTSYQVRVFSLMLYSLIIGFYRDQVAINN
jgi:hypothetical protein